MGSIEVYASSLNETMAYSGNGERFRGGRRISWRKAYSGKEDIFRGRGNHSERLHKWGPILWKKAYFVEEGLFRGIGLKPDRLPKWGPISRKRPIPWKWPEIKATAKIRAYFAEEVPFRGRGSKSERLPKWGPISREKARNQSDYLFNESKVIESRFIDPSSPETRLPFSLPLPSQHQRPIHIGNSNLAVQTSNYLSNCAENKNAENFGKRTTNIVVGHKVIYNREEWTNNEWKIDDDSVEEVEKRKKAVELSNGFSFFVFRLQIESCFIVGHSALVERNLFSFFFFFFFIFEWKAESITQHLMEWRLMTVGVHPIGTARVHLNCEC